MKPSSKLSRLAYLALPCALVLGSMSPAMATPVTFAQYIQANGAQQSWTITTNPTGTSVSASSAVFFSFSGVSGLPFSGPESAQFTLSASTNQPGTCSNSCTNGDSFSQAGYSGSFSFIDTGSTPGTNLLSGTFTVTGSPLTTGAQFSSVVNSTGGSFNASAVIGNLNQLVFTSAYLDFTGQTNENASWSLSSLIPNFSTTPPVAGEAFPGAGSYGASGTGTFSADPGPVLVPTTPVPAPFSIALLGFGLLGVYGAARRRSNLSK